MGQLPHYNNSVASSNKFEPVHQNLFEITFLPPTGVAGAPILLEHVLSVGGLDGVNIATEAIQQKYKFSDRSFAGMPSQTFVDIQVTFSLNLNDTNQMYVYKTLRAWKDKQYDPLTGIMGIKKDYVGTFIVVEFNRPGNIYRKLTFNDAFPSGQITGLDARDYNSSEPLTIQVTFRSDVWDESNS